MRSPRTLIPIALTTLRLVLGPLMIVLALRLPHPALWLATCTCIGMASDILDGTAARHLGVQSPALRRYDSRTDVVFWLCATACVWIIHPQLVKSHAWAIAALLLSQATAYLVTSARFGTASAHSSLAKAWGITIFIAFLWMLSRGEAGAPFWLMWSWGIVAALDVILITLLMPRLEHSVPSAWHAWRIRRRLRTHAHKLD